MPSAGYWQLDLKIKVDTEFPSWLNKVGVETLAGRINTKENIACYQGVSIALSCVWLAVALQ